jgi:Fe-S cluster biogenesis protein NfuA
MDLSFLDQDFLQDRESMTAEERLRIIKETIAEVRPVALADGGDIELVAIEGHRVKVRLTGCCSTCSMAMFTLGGIRRLLMKRLDAPVMVVPAE